MSILLVFLSQDGSPYVFLKKLRDPDGMSQHKRIFEIAGHSVKAWSAIVLLVDHIQ